MKYKKTSDKKEIVFHIMLMGARELFQDVGLTTDELEERLTQMAQTGMFEAVEVENYEDAEWAKITIEQIPRVIQFLVNEKRAIELRNERVLKLIHNE